MPHDPVKFREEMDAAGDGTGAADMRRIRDLRVLVQRQTCRVLQLRSYAAKDGAKEVQVPLPELHTNSKNLHFKMGPALDIQCLTSVVENDCLHVAANLRNVGCQKVAVLNMANRNTPGGGWRSGRGAQEETLCRRTTLLEHLAIHSYPIEEGQCLYNESVFVFRESEREGYGYTLEPFQVDVVSAAAVAHPRLVPSSTRKDYELDTHAADKLTSTLRAVVRTCKERGADGLVLGAIGCGAFANPPRHVARLWRKALEEEIAGWPVMRIVFAVVDDHNTRKAHNPMGNLRPFESEFSDADGS